MASTYTSNNGIEKPATGEQSGTWGDTTNTNFDIIDRTLNGVGSISLSGTTHTLTTTDGVLSDGHYKVLVLGGSPSGTNTITISPNDQDKLYFVYNNSGQDAVFTQGSGGDITVSNGETKIIYCDGAGASAKVSEIITRVSDDDAPQLSANLDVNGFSIVSTSNGNVVLAPNGTGDVHLNADTVRVGDSNANATVTTNGTGDLILNTNAGTNSGSITIADGTNGDISLSPNGTGTVVINTDLDVDNININGNTISSSNTNGNITIDPNGSGNVLIGNYTFDADQSVGAPEDNYVLTYDNSSGTISLEENPTTTITAPTRQEFYESGTWTRPSGCTKIKVTVVGGGGAGGSTNIVGETVYNGGGGGGGGTVIEYIDVSATSSVSVTVGTGGTGNTSGSGNAGGNTSFGTFCTANGGSGGGVSGGASGGSGTGSVNAVILDGGPGDHGPVTTLSASQGSGFGGGSTLGFGGQRIQPGTISAGNLGIKYGGGGSGAARSSGSGGGSKGGAGANGICIVEEYYT